MGRKLRKPLIYFLLIWACSLVQAQTHLTPTEYVVNTITITGNKSFATRWLKKQLRLKDRRWGRTKTFTRRLIELDRMLLETIYVKDGYIESAVRDSFKVRDNGAVDVFYFIQEGRQYFLKDIQINGNVSLTNDKILSILNHKLNKPYNPLRIREGIKEIRNRYANIGKPLAEVLDSLEVINRDIYLKIRIRENPTMWIGEIRLLNNVLVKDRPIRREILLKPGDLYSLEKINLSKRHIYETGLFSSVNIRTANIDTVSHTLDLIAEVRELNMRYLGLKFGLGQDRGITSGSEPYSSFTMDGEWLHRNIAGRGSRLSLNMGLSVNCTNIFNRPTTDASVNYIEPWLFGFRSSTSFKLFYQSGYDNDKLQTKYGEETALIYQPDRRLNASVGIIIQKVFWTDNTGVQNVDTTTKDKERAFTFQVRRDYRDNFLYPATGTVYTFDGKIVGTILGGTQDYYWFETSFSQYVPLWRQVIFAYRGKIGYQGPLMGQKRTPGYAKFYLGGGTSLRGWPERKFMAALFPDGGDVKALTNFEVRFPLFWLLGGELFIDGGGLVSARSSLSRMMYRWDAGFGLTIATPLGPIRIDIAKIINPRDNENRTIEWQFSIPYAF
jgi:outer membrane protein insertion porin family